MIQEYIVPSVVCILRERESERTMPRYRRVWALCFTLLLLQQHLKASAAPALSPEPSKNATAPTPAAETPSSSAAKPTTPASPPIQLTPPEASPTSKSTPPPTKAPALPPPLGSPASSLAPADAPLPSNSSTKRTTTPSPATPSSGRNGTLDPAQARAVAALGIAIGPDPCNTASQRNLICDDSTPFKHLIFLQLQYCTLNQEFPASAWDNLTTLQSLYFSDCPAKQMSLPKELFQSVTTLQVVASLGRSVENVLAPGLTGVWLSKFYNVRKLVVQDVAVNVSTLSFILNNMTHLQELRFSDTNLTGPLPEKWPSAGLISLEVSGNDFKGGIPATVAQLLKLNSLDLSSCNLSGTIPSSIGNLSLLQTLKFGSNRLKGPIPASLQKLATLQYLDLSNNQLNGSLPAFLARLPALRYLDLSNNNFKGQVPFNSSFIKSLNTFKVGSNALLCYNSSILSAKLVTGLQACDSNGLPPLINSNFSPSPAPAPETQGPPPSSGHHGPKRIVLIVAIALACIVGIIVFAIVLSRCCSSKG